VLAATPEGSAKASGIVTVGPTPAHRTLIKMAWNVLAARKVKSTGSAGLTAVKDTVTGLNVPGVNGGIVTTALIGTPTTVSDCKPVPALTWSTVTVPGPDVTPNDTKPPGKRSTSVTVVVGVQTCEVAEDANRENKIRNDMWP